MKLLHIFVKRIIADFEKLLLGSRSFLHFSVKGIAPFKQKHFCSWNILPKR